MESDVDSQETAGVLPRQPFQAARPPKFELR